MPPKNVSEHKEELDELEVRLEELRHKFDAFFQGLDRTPPTHLQAQLLGVMRRLREEANKGWNTAERFRINTLHQRFISYERMWMRTMSQIEEGTYKRDKYKVAQMRRREEEAEKKKLQEQSTKKIAIPGVEGIEVQTTGLTARAPAAHRPSAASDGSGGGGNTDYGGMTEQRMKQLYDVYMQAKQRTGEASRLSFDALKQQIAKQVPTIKDKHRCDQVEFKVVLKDGRAMLKAIPKV